MAGEIVRMYEGIEIAQRPADGYLNATAMCQATGKRWNDYWRLDNTKEFLVELSVSAGIPVDRIVVSKPGRPDRGGGTWVHPDVAIHLAQWCSARFAVQVSRWIRELLTTGCVELPGRATLLPYTHRCLEMRLVVSSIPDGYWAVFCEAAQFLITAEQVIAPAGLEADYDDLLDGSIGMRWSNYRRGQVWARPHRQFCYRFPPPSRREGIVIEPRCYEHSELLPFRRWLEHHYVRCHFSEYVRRKWGPAGLELALPHIRRQIPEALPAPARPELAGTARR